MVMMRKAASRRDATPWLPGLQILKHGPQPKSDIRSDGERRDGELVPYVTEFVCHDEGVKKILKSW